MYLWGKDSYLFKVLCHCVDLQNSDLIQECNDRCSTTTWCFSILGRQVQFGVIQLGSAFTLLWELVLGFKIFKNIVLPFAQNWWGWWWPTRKIFEEIRCWRSIGNWLCWMDNTFLLERYPLSCHLISALSASIWLPSFWWWFFFSTKSLFVSITRIHMLIPHPQGDGIWRWGLLEMIRSWGWTFHEWD